MEGSGTRDAPRGLAVLIAQQLPVGKGKRGSRVPGQVFGDGLERRVCLPRDVVCHRRAGWRCSAPVPEAQLVAATLTTPFSGSPGLHARLSSLRVVNSRPTALLRGDGCSIAQKCRCRIEMCETGRFVRPSALRLFDSGRKAHVQNQQVLAGRIKAGGCPLRHAQARATSPALCAEEERHLRLG